MECAVADAVRGDGLPEEGGGLEMELRELGDGMVPGELRSQSEVE